MTENIPSETPEKPSENSSEITLEEPTITQPDPQNETETEATREPVIRELNPAGQAPELEEPPAAPELDPLPTIPVIEQEPSPSTPSPSSDPKEQPDNPEVEEVEVEEIPQLPVKESIDWGLVVFILLLAAAIIWGIVYWINKKSNG